MKAGLFTWDDQKGATGIKAAGVAVVLSEDFTCAAAVACKAADPLCGGNLIAASAVLVPDQQSFPLL
jgi:hypothetical protein